MRPADFLRALDRSHHMPTAACPRCLNQINCSTGVVDDDPPKPGDFSLCTFCEASLVYQADLSFRLMTDAEIAALDDDELLSLLYAVEAARMMRKAIEP